MNKEVSYDLSLKINILRELGYSLGSDTTIMDFGCGAGKAVQELRDLGYQAFGCDIKFKSEPSTETETLHQQQVLRLIGTEPYRLPFDDNSVDIVFSDQVLEHVQNYSETLAEISRVLKPNGCCLHIFPSRYKPVEAHVFVPFSGIFQSYGWLLFWAKLGIHKPDQAGLTAQEIARQNHAYLTNCTNYLSKKQLTEEFNKHFGDVQYCEKAFLKHSQRGQRIHTLAKIFPFLPSVYSTLRARVVVTQKPLKENEAPSHMATQTHSMA